MINTRKNDTLIYVKIIVEDMNKMTKWDKWIIVVALILSLSFVLFFARKDLHVKKKAVIRVDGKVEAEILLDGSRIGEKITFQTKYGCNVLEVGDEWVRMIEATCPDKLDVKQGKITRVGERIICLPHRLVVEIVGEEPVKLDGLSR